MNKYITLSAFFLFFISCKKGTPDFDAASQEASVKSQIIGTWYYQANSVTYYDSNNNSIYTDVATQSILYDSSSYVFQSDNKGYYGGDTFSYTIKSDPKGDSVILSGEINNRLKVSFYSGLLLLRQNYKSITPFRDQSGNTLRSATAGQACTFAHTRVSPN